MTETTETEMVEVPTPGGGVLRVPAEYAHSIEWVDFPPANGPGIVAAMLAVMTDVGAIGKTRKMGTGNNSYAYRSIEDVLPVLHDAFIEHGIVAMCTDVSNVESTAVVSKGGGAGWRVIATFEWTFYARDGSALAAASLGEAIDYGDKSANKAMTAAQKYAMVQSLSIAYENAADPDHSQPDGGAPRSSVPDPAVVFVDEFSAAMRALSAEAREQAKVTLVGLGYDLTAGALKRLPEADREELLAAVKSIALEPAGETSHN